MGRGNRRKSPANAVVESELTSIFRNRTTPLPVDKSKGFINAHPGTRGPVLGDLFIELINSQPSPAQCTIRRKWSNPGRGTRRLTSIEPPAIAVISRKIKRRISDHILRKFCSCVNHFWRGQGPKRRKRPAELRPNPFVVSCFRDLTFNHEKHEGGAARRPIAAPPAG